MLNKLSKVSQCSAVTIALAFLIVPTYGSNSYIMKVMPFPGEDVNAEDTDGDGITDDEDICIEEDYDLQYHESCLNMAGLRVPTAVEFSAADQAYMEMNEALGIRGNSNPTPDDPYEVSSYKDLAIKT